MKKPNIVLIMTDQQRRDSLGVYGCGYVSTPNLDRLAQESTVYDHCYCNTPVCTPSRASVMTGKNITGHGVYNLFDILPQEERLLPSYLKDQGYDTALIGKLHVSGIVFERDHRNAGDGFDVYELCHEASIHMDGKFNGYARWLKEKDPEEYERVYTEGRKRKFRPASTHFSTWVGERSAEYVRERGEKPFFLMSGLFDPHNPYDHYPQEAASWLNEDCYEEPVRSEADFDCPEGVKLERELHGSKTPPTDQQLHDMRRDYFASISFLDRQVGKLIDALKEEGIYDDTLIVFTSDHGDMLGDHYLYTKGSDFYEDCTNVPLLIKYPGQKQMVRSNRLVQLNDLFSTLLQAGGGDVSIRPESLALQDENERPFAVCEYRGSGKCDDDVFPYPVLATMYRTDKYKLNMFYDTCETQLFDMEEDPDELHDLSKEPEYLPTVLRLTQEYMRYQAREDHRMNAARGGRSETPDFANVPIRGASPKAADGKK
ncbi:MAG: sulfatase-like hydrolase/transferase [Hungatella sp.]|nr:sulfatase-like hydrolase/transferase [Hungatella sp.]